ncbi:MAG: carbohydrate ABC transporter permease [Propionibacteriaceae bacterium]|jgi:multiple sugar transport system permease protein|nr:carbohydrate ABC transporter permease [Propionibacteriaceae bacterium]
MRRTTIANLLAVAGLVLLSLFVLLPFAWMLSASLRTQGDLLAHPGSLWPQPFTLHNYIDIWHKIPFGRQFANTVAFAAVVSVCGLALDSMAGYALARFQFRGRQVVFIAIMVTLMLPIQVTFVPVYNLLINLGWINSLPGLIVPRVADAFGVFFMRQFFIALPRDLEDAATIDGANQWRIFSRVMAPLASSAMLTLLMFHFIANWNDLLWPLMVMTDNEMQTMPAGLALFKGQHTAEYGPLMAGAVVALLPIVGLFLVVQRRFIEGIATTGMK